MNYDELIDISLKQIQILGPGDAKKVESIKTHIMNVKLKDGRVAKVWILVEI